MVSFKKPKTVETPADIQALSHRLAEFQADRAKCQRQRKALQTAPPLTAEQADEVLQGGVAVLDKISPPKTAELDRRITELDNLIVRCQDKLDAARSAAAAEAVREASTHYRALVEATIAGIETAQQSLRAIKSLPGELKKQGHDVGQDAFPLPRGPLGANVADLIRMILGADTSAIRECSAPDYIRPLLGEVSEPSTPPKNYVGRFHKCDSSR
jgi:hypothetical protein